MDRNDDQLATRIRAASPARTPLDARPNQRALELRDRIMDAPSPSQVGSFPRALAAAAAVLAVLVVTAVSFLLPRAPASAVTPAPVAFTGTTTVDEVAQAAHAALRTSGGLQEPRRFSRTVLWGLSVDVLEQRAEIVPQVVTLEWNADLSGTFTATAGEPYWPTDADRSGGASTGAQTGDLLSEMTFAPGEFGTPVTELPGSTRQDMLALLSAFGMPESASPAEVLQTAIGVFDQWTLTNDQHAQLISILVDAGETTALGYGHDREGRPVAGIRMDSPFPGVEDVAMISTENGRIVGVESKRMTPDGIVPAGAVISYKLWGTE